MYCFFDLLIDLFLLRYFNRFYRSLDITNAFGTDLLLFPLFPVLPFVFGNNFCVDLLSLSFLVFCSIFLCFFLFAFQPTLPKMNADGSSLSSGTNCAHKREQHGNMNSRRTLKTQQVKCLAWYNPRTQTRVLPVEALTVVVVVLAVAQVEAGVRCLSHSLSLSLSIIILLSVYSSLR